MLIKYLEPDFVDISERGYLKQLVHEGWKQVNVIQTNAGSKRGGHYHKQNNELFYVVSGKFQLIVWRDNQEEKYTMCSGQMFKISPFVFHTFNYLEDTLLVSMYDNGVEFENGKMDIWTE